MPELNDITMVKRSQSGDQAAFAELVTKYQALAIAAAYGWLGDMDLARDMAQEAFVDAYQHLQQLREPAAFPGWFRQIVIKHCDRLTRRGALATTTLEHDSDLPAPTANPEIHTEIDELHQHLRLAVDALPATQRIVVALHYFAELTGAEVASFLDLPLSTIKQRLRVARKQLKENSDALLKETLHAMQPTSTTTFTEEIAFFIALRAGEQNEVRRLLALRPSLVDTVQQWDADVVYNRVLPFANKATPLITAIERNDLAMLRVLLEAGADVNGKCHCQTGEAPLWAAAVLNRYEHAQLLLEYHAEPDVLSGAGNTALHVAAMRGMTDMVRLLLRYEADPNVADQGKEVRGQWSPADGQSSAQARNAAQWAETNAHTKLAALIRKFSTGGPTNTPMPRKIPTQIHESIVHTGIKALDLFAPLVRGSLTRFPFMAGVGMVVLLGELSQRFLSMPTGRVVWTGFTQPPFDLGDWEADLSEFGLIDKIDASIEDFAASPDARRRAFAQGLGSAETLCEEGNDVLTILLTAPGFEHDIEASLARMTKSHADGSITTIVITSFPEQRDATPTLSAPYTGQLVLDRARAKQRLFPALDPRFTKSRGLAENLVGARHMSLAQRSAKLINAYREFDPTFEQLDLVSSQPSSDQQVRAAAIIRYLCQPFVTTEPFTGRPGEQVSRTDMLDTIERLLNVK